MRFAGQYHLGLCIHFRILWFSSSHHSFFFLLCACDVERLTVLVLFVLQLEAQIFQFPRTLNIFAQPGLDIPTRSFTRTLLLPYPKSTPFQLPQFSMPWINHNRFILGSNWAVLSVLETASKL